MSKNLIKYFQFLVNLDKNPNEKTKKLVIKALAKDPNIYLALKEIAINVIKGNIPLEENIKSELRKHKRVICAIANTNKSVCAKKRKKLVVQSGGWLWVLPLISTIIDLFK